MSLFLVWISGSGGDFVQGYLHQEIWWLSCSAERNHLLIGNCARGHYENNFSEIILNLDQ